MKKLILSFLLAVSFISKSQSIPFAINYEIGDSLKYLLIYSPVTSKGWSIAYNKAVISKSLLGKDSTLYVFSVEEIYNFRNNYQFRYYNDTIIYSNSFFKGLTLGFDKQNRTTYTRYYYPYPDFYYQSNDTTITYTSGLGLTKKEYYTNNGANFTRINLIYANIGGKIYDPSSTVGVITNIDDASYNSYISLIDNNLCIFNYDKYKPVYIYNMQGVMSMQVTGKDEIDLSTINNGLYNVKYTNSNNITKTEKFIKE